MAHLDDWVGFDAAKRARANSIGLRIVEMHLEPGKSIMWAKEHASSDDMGSRRAKHHVSLFDLVLKHDYGPYLCGNRLRTESTAKTSAKILDESPKPADSPSRINNLPAALGYELPRQFSYHLQSNGVESLVAHVPMPYLRASDTSGRFLWRALFMRPSGIGMPLKCG